MNKTYVEFHFAAPSKVIVTKVCSTPGIDRVEVWYWADNSRRPKKGDILSIYQEANGKPWIIAP